MSSLFRYQPFKAAYLTYELVALLFVRAPVWFLLAIPRSWRPRRSWDIRRVMMCRLIRHLGVVTSRTGPLRSTPNHLAITPGPDVNGVWVPGAPKQIVGEVRLWANVAGVVPISIPGYWLHKKGSTIKVAAPPMPGEKVVYALHGGAYARLSAHPSDITASIARGLLQHVDTVHRIFSIEYRLSSDKPGPEANPFPAALLDAIAGYKYLIHDVGFDPSDIIVEGDSAGGNLALALAMYLVEHPDIGLSAPSALILLSPWVDLSLLPFSPSSSFAKNCKCDYIGEPKPNNFFGTIKAFLGPHGLGAGEINPYISPASTNPAMTISFKGFPRTFISAGGAEVLYDQISHLKSRMVKDLGEGDGVRVGDGKVRFHVAEDGVHDYVVFGFHEPERTETLKEIANWVAA